MIQLTQTFLGLIKLGIGMDLKQDSANKLLALTMKQWEDVMTLAEKQGVSAVAIDGVQRLYDVYGKGIKATTECPTEWIRWVLECAGTMTQYEQCSIKQKEIINEISDIWATQCIKMMVFKGQVNASFYSKPEHRATGDIDCYLFGEADRGDIILKDHGATVDNRWYRHSKILYKGETIENHRMMSHTRGSRKKKEMEAEFKSILQTEDLQYIPACGKALMPTVQFNACFLIYHGLHHFLSEGLRIKQILDWAMFLQKEQEMIDWPAFNNFCKRYKFDKFAAAMNCIALEYLGIKLKCVNIVTDDTYVERIIQSTLYDDDYLFNSGKGDWCVRWQLVKNMLIRDRWKYRDVAQENVWLHLLQNIKGFVFG